jgi:quercetin dioxygenase-like cupin family protein
MKQHMIKKFGAAVLSIAITQAAAQTSGAGIRAQEITRAGTQTSTAGPAEWFTGRVRVDPLWPADAAINSSGAWVTFEPGARSAWHSHPIGQRLVVTSGQGFTQEWGKPVQVIRPGDVVLCPPGVKHWHGASPTTAMTHLAITGTVDAKNATWMEQVSDEQYNAALIR